MHRRGKKIALSTAVLALMVALAAAISSKERILEELYRRQLRSQSVEDRRVAVRRLEDLHSEKAVPDLLSLTEDSDADVRQGAAQAMIAAGPKGISVLMDKVLCGTARETLEAVSRALEQKEVEARESVVPLLIGSLRHKDRLIRFRTARWLQRLGPLAKPAVPSLIQALGDWADDVREEAVYALGRIGPDAKEAINPLLKAFEQNEQMKRAAVFALNEIGGEALPALEEALQKSPIKQPRSCLGSPKSSVGTE